MPDRQLIDDVTPNHPVLVNRFDSSVFLANSRALTLAGITDTTPNPEGGEFVRDASGRLTGLLKGSAVAVVRKAVTPISFEQRLVQVRAVLQEAREGGVTTMQDLTSADQLRAYQTIESAGELTSRIMLRPTLDNADRVAGLGLTRGFGNDWLKFIGYKAWVDGIMGNSSAMFFEPYSNNAANKGTLRPIMRPEGRDGFAAAMTVNQHYTDAPPGNVEQLLRVAARTGLTPHIHAIGDKAVRIILDIFERVLREEKLLGTDHRWRVIHAQVVHPEDFPRFGKLGLVAEINPYHVSDDMRWMEERIGRERSQGAYAFRTLKKSGAVLMFGSDSPGTNAARYYLNPVYGLYAAVSRQTLGGEPKAGWFPAERLTIEEAIEAATKNPAWASFEESIKGTLTPGKLADIAVFDTNLVEVGKSDPSRLLKAKVRYTIVDGKIVYTATAVGRSFSPGDIQPALTVRRATARPYTCPQPEPITEQLVHESRGDEIRRREAGHRAELDDVGRDDGLRSNVRRRSVVSSRHERPPGSGVPTAGMVPGSRPSRSIVMYTVSESDPTARSIQSGSSRMFQS